MARDEYLEAQVDKLSNVDKQMSQTGEVVGTKKAVAEIETVNEQIVVLPKRHGQLNQMGTSEDSLTEDSASRVTGIGKQRLNIDDPLSPFFVHHSESPNLTLVSELLDGDNYVTWSRFMKLMLSAKNKLGFVNGEIQKPSKEDVRLLSSWNRNNSLVMSWILNSVSEEIYSSIIFCKSAMEMWKDLEERFQQSRAWRVFQLQHELVNLVQERKTVSEYFTKCKTIHVELSYLRPSCSSVLVAELKS